mmetsp:Transcript_28636/g.81911  ORF Transcript_28636/g.81911 Transcript_28636/m.81911 type:complete len:211 (+) Transcript_28636:200-832(+)
MPSRASRGLGRCTSTARTSMPRKGRTRTTCRLSTSLQLSPTRSTGSRTSRGRGPPGTGRQRPCAPCRSSWATRWRRPPATSWRRRGIPGRGGCWLLRDSPSGSATSTRCLPRRSTKAASSGSPQSRPTALADRRLRKTARRSFLWNPSTGCWARWSTPWTATGPRTSASSPSGSSTMTSTPFGARSVKCWPMIVSITALWVPMTRMSLCA